MKKSLITIGIIVSLVIASVAFWLISYLWVFPHLHDKTLREFYQSLTSIPVPEETNLIDSLSEVGQQSGNSDHCDYLAAELLKTNLSKSEIENYYIGNYKGN